MSVSPENRFGFFLSICFLKAPKDSPGFVLNFVLNSLAFLKVGNHNLTNLYAPYAVLAHFKV